MKLVSKILELQNKVVGMNERNYSLVMKNNPRKHFHFANDKSICKQLLHEHNIPTPTTYCVITSMGEIDAKLKCTETLTSMVIKPAMGYGGSGILLLKKNAEGKWQTPSGTVYEYEQIKFHLANILFGRFSKKQNDKAIIEYLLVTHSFMSSIYHRGVPDFRIIMLNQKPLLAMLRMPTDLSDGKANLHCGAIGLGVNIENGTLESGYCQVTNKMVINHPDSNVRFQGMQLPEWERTLEIAIATAKAFPLNYLGIDIVYDQDHGPMVIEINGRPGMQIQNVTSTGLKQIINQLEN